MANKLASFCAPVKIESMDSNKFDLAKIKTRFKEPIEKVVKT